MGLFIASLAPALLGSAMGWSWFTDTSDHVGGNYGFALGGVVESEVNYVFEKISSVSDWWDKFNGVHDECVSNYVMGITPKNNTWTAGWRHAPESLMRWCERLTSCVNRTTGQVGREKLHEVCKDRLETVCKLDNLVAYPGCVDWMPEHCYGFISGQMKLGWNHEVTDIECYDKAELNQECVEAALATGCDEAAYDSTLGTMGGNTYSPDDPYASLREYTATQMTNVNAVIEQTELQAELACPKMGINSGWDAAGLLGCVDPFNANPLMYMMDCKLARDAAAVVFAVAHPTGSSPYDICDEAVGKMLAIDARMTSAKVDCVASGLGKHDPCYGDGTMDWDAMEIVNDFKDKDLISAMTGGEFEGYGVSINHIETVLDFLPWIGAAQFAVGFIGLPAKIMGKAGQRIAKIGRACKGACKTHLSYAAKKVDRLCSRPGDRRGEEPGGPWEGPDRCF